MVAIYQRTRPITWDEVVGQEHVKDVLRPALEKGKLGHAYLFSGPRGVGKTTTARLIAMTANCEAAQKPCGQCESCRSVILGRHPDVLEIDAASNNGVDDVRDLREKVALQPMLGTRKIYILDEAHMMTKSAFNALLKTLEEPPSHVVFVLATTEPERMPATILSRCQHYRFRRLSVEEIAGKLGRVAKAENVETEQAALDLMARASDGAMRDGESLLERMLTTGEKITARSVEDALGLPPHERIQNLAFALARGESKIVLDALAGLYQDGFAARTITERAKLALRDQLHETLAGKSTEFSESRLLKLIRALDEEDARFVRAADLMALELAFTKAMLSEETAAADDGLVDRVAKLERLLASGAARPEAEPRRVAKEDFFADPRAASVPSSAAIPERPRQDMNNAAATPVLNAAQNSATGAGWNEVVSEAAVQLKAFLKEARGAVNLAEQTVIIEYGPKHKFHADSVARRLEDVAELVRRVVGANFGVELVMPDGAKKNSKSGGGNFISPAAQPAPVVVVSGHPVPQSEPVSTAVVVATKSFAEPMVQQMPQMEAAAVVPEIVVPEVMAVQASTRGSGLESVAVSVPVSFVALGEPTPTHAELAEQIEAEPIETGQAGPEDVVPLVQHPRYQTLNRLFAHRVRAAGSFASQTELTEPQDEPDPTASSS